MGEADGASRGGSGSTAAAGAADDASKPPEQAESGQALRRRRGRCTDKHWQMPRERPEVRTAGLPYIKTYAFFIPPIIVGE